MRNIVQMLLQSIHSVQNRTHFHRSFRTTKSAPVFATSDRLVARLSTEQTRLFVELRQEDSVVSEDNYLPIERFFNKTFRDFLD